MTWGVPAPISAAIRRTTPDPPNYSFTPYVAPGPNTQVAAGYYDPALLAALGNAQTGLTRQTQDTQTALQRLAGQLGIDQAAVNTQSGRTVQDARTAMQRGTEDHSTALADLARNYKMLAGQQLQTANAAGVLRGGAMAQAAAKRAENQSHDQAPIDTVYNRGQQDAQTQIGRAEQDRATALANLQNQYGISTADLSLALTRSGQDVTQFGLDTQASAGYQAQQNGFVPPAPRPSNEFGSGADAHRVVLTSTERLVVAPNGSIISRSPR